VAGKEKKTVQNNGFSHLDMQAEAEAGYIYVFLCQFMLDLTQQAKAKDKKIYNPTKTRILS
jgi:hypothetical protein